MIQKPIISQNNYIRGEEFFDNEPYQVIDTFTPAQKAEMCALITDDSTAATRSEDEIYQMLQQSDLVLGCLHPRTQKIVGFVRIITDFCQKAWLVDLRVAPDYRKQGIGRFLVQKMLSSPSLKNVKQFELICAPERLAFYEHLGFQDISTGRKIMRLSL